MKTMNFHRTLLLVLALLAAPVACYAQAWSVGVSIGIAPPLLPVYEQPPCPAVGYLWTPGYWAYDPEDGYYWVPGTWVVAPAPGLLWTPGYWGFGEGFYSWHAGYWGPRVGFYGGVNYGFGYFGSGFAGGYWDRGAFFYNRSVTNITNVSITNVYNQTVVNERVTNGRASHNGGPGGIQARPSAAEQEAARAVHYGATAEQHHHDSAARALPALRASVNHGVPPVAATPRPAVFAGHDVRAAQTGQTPIPRGPGSTPVSRANVVPGRSPSERPVLDAARGQGAHPVNVYPNAARQPAAPRPAPERPALAYQSAQLGAPTRSYPVQSGAPARSYSVQPGAPARSYSVQPAAAARSYQAQAPIPHRESARPSAPPAPRAGVNPAPAREGGQGPRREPNRG
jgi:hypothetical protein